MDNANSKRVWRVRILASTWLSYAGFYFCRKNFAIAKSSIKESLQITNSELAHITCAYLFSYMIGQFAMSYFGKKVAIRLLLLSGMAITLICNIAFGFSYLLGPAGYWPMLLFMVINGLAQASGWPGNVAILSNWLERKERGGVMSIWATSYQIGSILAKTFAAFMLGALGAAWSFYGAAAIMFFVWIIFFLLEKDTPESAGLEPIIEEVEDKHIRAQERNIMMTIFFMGTVYFVFKFLRYSLDSWAPMTIETIFLISKAKSGCLSTIFDWVGFLGVLFAGQFSDKIFRGRRHQTIFLMTCGMFCAFLLMAFVGALSPFAFCTCLALCGFMLMGPDSLIAGVGAIDVGGKGRAIMAAGIINGLGSNGPILQEELIGQILDRYGHRLFLHFLVIIAFLGVIGTAYLSHRSRIGKSNL